MYDFTAALNAAKEVVERSTEQGTAKEYTYPLVYPQKGHTIVVRPLFNPASGQIVRLVRRHEKIPCYKTYNVECPICKIMEQVKNSTGQDPFGRSKATRTRGICFAQYISSTNPIDKGNNQGNLQPGDIILFMFPWSVYEQINTMIQAIGQTPTGMDQAFCHAQQGFFIQVNATADFKYSTTNVPYMTFPSRMSDDDFMKLLDSMESLNDQVIPSTITEDVQRQVKEYEDGIYKQYISPQVPNVGNPNVMPQQMGGMTGFIPNPMGGQTTTGQPVPSLATVSNQVNDAPFTPTNVMPQQTNGVPQCYGQHAAGTPRCIVCPLEAQCIDVQNK